MGRAIFRTGVALRTAHKILQKFTCFHYGHTRAVKFRRLTHSVIKILHLIATDRIAFAYAIQITMSRQQLIQR